MLIDTMNEGVKRLCCSRGRFITEANMWLHVALSGPLLLQYEHDNSSYIPLSAGVLKWMMKLGWCFYDLNCL